MIRFNALLATTALVGLLSFASAADAGVVTKYTYNGAAQTYVAAVAGVYEIDAFGAQGDGGSNGGEAGAQFSLAAGESLNIIVGAALGNRAGGGGSWVFDNTNTLLEVAGGGGGGGLAGSASSVGGGAAGSGFGGGGGGGFYAYWLGGNNYCWGGGGGGGGAKGGGSGGGWGCASNGVGGNGGVYTVGGGGGASGGYSGGGGGGYTGGNGGSMVSGLGTGTGYTTLGNGGQGGTSYISSLLSSHDILLAGNHAGAGEVDISMISASVPEPASMALFGVGMTWLAYVRRRKVVRD